MCVKKVGRIIGIGTVMIFLSSVTTCSTVPPRETRDTKEIHKIPFRAGLYISPDFLNYTYKKSAETGDGRKFVTTACEVGEFLRNGSERLVRNIFQEAIILSSKDDAKTQNVDVVLSPEIQSVDVVKPLLTGGGWPLPEPHIKALFITKWTVTDQNGIVKWVGTYEGEGKVGTGSSLLLYWFTGGKKSCECVQLAIEDQFGKALEGITSSNWWVTNNK
jgi:hypothetical protein